MVLEEVSEVSGDGVEGHGEDGRTEQQRLAQGESYSGVLGL